MGKVSQIIEKAVKNGACYNSNKATDWKSLVWLFFTPQGCEFCENTNTPSIEEFREMDECISDFGVFVDKGEIYRSNDAKIALIGNTQGKLIFDDNTKVHKVILMHGAKVFIVARNFAVIRLVNIGNCEVKINKDKNSVILL